ncbi:MAG: hypothetical protein ACXIT4_12790 [Erythrobacter sp.]
MRPVFLSQSETFGHYGAAIISPFASLAAAPVSGSRSAIPGMATIAAGEPSSALGESILPTSVIVILIIAAAAAAIGLALAVRRMRQARAAKPLALAAPAHSRPEEHKAITAPARIAVDLAIVTAARSVMNFTLEYRIELTNRSNRSVHDLSIAARLSCARRSTDGGAPPEPTPGHHSVARLGPHQSRSITGTIRLPVADIAVLQQGKTPLFVPLFGLAITGEGCAPLDQTYVIGTPSTASAARLHPLPLDQLPGSITGLRARLVEIPAAPQTQ